jgi:DNA helicase-2/ATP-dependent DNA helicase PcrA
MSEQVPTPEQIAAIDYSNSLVAIAKPGSGKTFVLARKIRNVLSTLLDHQGVIAISYTNKSSEELRR